MGYNTNATRSFEQLNPALPKWIIIHDTDSSDILSVPIGLGSNVIVSCTGANKAIVLIKEAGHNGTWLAHTKKDCSFTINSSGGVPSDPAVSGAVIRGILAFITDNNPGSTRVLEILPNTIFNGANTGNITINWDV